MSDWGKTGELERVLAAVPVVTAWHAAMAKAAQGGYEFRVPKFQPRNSKNEPDELESRALKELTAGAKTNTTRSTRPRTPSATSGPSSSPANA